MNAAKRSLLIIFCLLAYPNLVFSQTHWTGSDGDEWNDAAHWDQGPPNAGQSANFSIENTQTIEITSPADVQGIQKGGRGNIILKGATLTLGEGYTGGFNSILVNAGTMEINCDLVNSANKRITLNSEAESLTLNGGLDTGGKTTQIGNLGQGKLTFNGNRTGGNSLLVVDGKVVATGILSNTGGGNTQVLKKGVVLSSREDGPTIQGGSRGLALRPEGTFEFGADNQIAGFVNLNGGTLDLAGFSNDQFTIGNLSLTEDSTIDFSDPAAEALIFGDVSENPEWKTGARLHILGFSEEDSLRFGDHAGALTAAQLAAIHFDGKPAKIDDQGFVTPAP